jgi:hypothetical protein
MKLENPGKSAFSCPERSALPGCATPHMLACPAWSGCGRKFFDLSAGIKWIFEIVRRGDSPTAKEFQASLHGALSVGGCE